MRNRVKRGRVVIQRFWLADAAPDNASDMMHSSVKGVHEEFSKNFRKNEIALFFFQVLIGAWTSRASWEVVLLAETKTEDGSWLAKS